jgi:hypothetical protein
MYEKTAHLSNYIRIASLLQLPQAVKHRLIYHIAGNLSSLRHITPSLPAQNTDIAILVSYYLFLTFFYFYTHDFCLLDINLLDKNYIGSNQAKKLHYCV